MLKKYNKCGLLMWQKLIYYTMLNLVPVTTNWIFAVEKYEHETLSDAKFLLKIKIKS